MLIAVLTLGFIYNSFEETSGEGFAPDITLPLNETVLDTYTTTDEPLIKPGFTKKSKSKSKSKSLNKIHINCLKK